MGTKDDDTKFASGLLNIMYTFNNLLNDLLLCT